MTIERPMAIDEPTESVAVDGLVGLMAIGGSIDWLVAEGPVESMRLVGRNEGR